MEKMKLCLSQQKGQENATVLSKSDSQTEYIQIILLCEAPQIGKGAKADSRTVVVGLGESDIGSGCLMAIKLQAHKEFQRSAHVTECL